MPNESWETPDDLFEQISSSKNQKKFWQKVDKTEICWNWIANKDKDGYGKFQLGGKGNQKHYRAHRLSYLMFYKKLICLLIFYRRGL